MIVTDDNGVPDHAVDAQEVADDGFTLACRIGAARGDLEALTAALNEVVCKWDDKAGYVMSAALATLGRDLIPMVSELAKASTGVDFARHCEAMMAGNYDPQAVDDD